MRFLTAPLTAGDYRLPELRRLGWGRMFSTEKAGGIEPGDLWGLDNGAFAAWKHGRSWDAGRYLVRLETAREAARIQPPLLTIVPDKVADAASLAYSLDWLKRLPAEFPWFLAVQDGMTEGRIREVLRAEPAIRGLFMGGNDAFKGTAPGWCGLAHDEGRLFHYGRAATVRRLAWCREFGADSCDSVRPAMFREVFGAFRQVWEAGFPQAALPMEVASGPGRDRRPRAFDTPRAEAGDTGQLDFGEEWL